MVFEMPESGLRQQRLHETASKELAGRRWFCANLYIEPFDDHAATVLPLSLQASSRSTEGLTSKACENTSEALGEAQTWHTHLLQGRPSLQRPQALMLEILYVAPLSQDRERCEGACAS